MFLFLKEDKWPKQNETWCFMHTRPCTYMCSIYKRIFTAKLLFSKQFYNINKTKNT